MTTHNPTLTGQLTDIPPYQPRRQWRSQMLPVRNMHYHQRSWEPEPVSGIDPELPVLVLAHGWMDVAASYLQKHPNAKFLLDKGAASQL